MRSEILESGHYREYGRQCPLYSICYFSFACASLDSNQHSPINKFYLEKDKIIFRNQIETDCIYVILSGILTTFIYLPTGEAVVIANLGKGQTVGETEAFVPNKDVYDVKMLTSIMLCRLPLDYLTQLVRLFPSNMKAFFLASERAVRSMGSQLWIMNAQRIYTRLARLLIILSHLGLEKADGITSINVSHEDLGFLINTDRVTITNSLHRLEKEGLVILDYNKIRVTDSLITRFSEQGSKAMIV